MSEEPKDEIVKDAILNTISKLDDHIRPNKLRKIICKSVKGTNWTQFQKILDLLIKGDASQSIPIPAQVRTFVVNDEVVISPLGHNTNLGVLASAPISSSTSTSTSTSLESLKNTIKNEKKTESAQMKVPLAIVYHLVKKGKKKQKNLELNTKTKFIFKSKDLAAIKHKDFDPKERVTFTIEALDDGNNDNNCDNENDEDSNANNDNNDKNDNNSKDDVATKHIKTAKYMINTMCKAFEKNPAHYCPQKAGGTFKEQAETKKQKLEAKQKWKKKNPDSHDDDNDESLARKRQRKFY